MPIFGRIGGQFVIPDRKAPGHQARKPVNTAPAPAPAPRQAAKAKPATRKVDSRPRLVIDHDRWELLSRRHFQLYKYRGAYYLSDINGGFERLTLDDARDWAEERGYSL